MPGNHFRGYLLSVFGWVAAAQLFMLIRYVGLTTVPEFEGFDLSQINYAKLFAKSLMLGGILGSVFYLLDRALNRPALRRKPFGVLMIVQTAGNLLLVVVALVAVALIEMAQTEQGVMAAGLVRRVISTNFMVAASYVTVVSFLFGFFKQVDRKFGPGNLWKLLIGMYHHPREEERIFMFLDLEASTTHAERLGHVKFSRLIQDCFIDLSVVIDHYSQVYQYVGDEAILFWDVEDGLRDANCVRAYFRYVDQLEARSDYYESQYGVVPVFKAGINIGSVTVLEVGEIKREISYLGDVLNTAARIQGKCGDLGERLLIAEKLCDQLTNVPDDLTMSPIGSVELRGREEEVKIISVHRDQEEW